MGKLFSCLGKTDRAKPDDATTPNVEDGPSPPPTDANFARTLLQVQNGYRATHGAEPLELDDSLCTAAQRWADHLKDLGKLQHADTEDGENLAFAYPALTAQGAADMWYNEKDNYDFSKPGFSSNTGHFTQMVWVGSKKFGAAIAKGPKGEFVVGRYRPAGNVTNAGFFQANVLPAK